VYDHGENRENYKGSAEVMAAYRATTAGIRHTVPRPGGKIPIRGLDITVITAGGKRIDMPLPHAGARNEVCGAENRKPDEQSENASSIGILVQFGNFRMLDLSDVLWNQELDLMCPVNRIGPAGLLVVSHHGKDTSNSGTLIRAVHPRVAIMDNSESEGGSPATFGVLRNSPGFEDLWQLHYSIAAGNRNTPEKFIANPQGVCNGSGIQVVAAKDGSFRVINERSHLEKMYAATE
jgi:competence protein ComEC